VIGSYPKFEEGKFSTELVVRARDEKKLDAAGAAIEKMLADIQQ
jgi:hypothetical protein